MKLREYLNCNHIKYNGFSKMLGVSPSTVNLWLNTKTKPLLIMRKKIEELTQGAVSLADWEEEKQKKEENKE